MTSYKPHCACFSCRKTFKRRLLNDVDRNSTEEKRFVCPECGGPMADMGLDFESPKKNDIKGWNHMARLYSVGITFHSCGCNGPGYLPNTTKGLIDHFERIKYGYLEHQHFWARRREQPQTQSEIDKDFNKNWQFLNATPLRYNPKSKDPGEFAQKAQVYWGGRIKAIQEYIDKLKKSESE